MATDDYVEKSFCSICGTLMYRRSSGFPGISAPRIGTIDDFMLQETKLKPRIDVFEKDRCAWLLPGKIQDHVHGAYFTAGQLWKGIHDGISDCK